MSNSWLQYATDIGANLNRGKSVVVPEARLRTFCIALLEGLGVPEHDARLTSDVFLQSDLRGEESHGIRLFAKVVRRLQAGGDRAKALVTVVRDRGAIALLDGNRSLGQVVAAQAMELAIEKARLFGVGVVGVRNTNSHTSAKYYPLMAAAKGMIGICYANSGVQIVAPHGAHTAVVGTNPMAIAAPAKQGPPFVLDMAISTAMEKIFQAHEQNRPIPEGWAMDSEGRETNDAGKALVARTLMPWGGYKGFGLGLAHEILTCVLMGGQLFGGGATGFMPYDEPMNVSQHFQAIDIESFVPLEEFMTRMDQVFQTVKSAKVRPGFDEVFYPGEKGFREQRSRMENGIPVQDLVLEELNEVAKSLSVEALEAQASSPPAAADQPRGP